MKRYVIVGAGGRALTMFAKPITSEFKEFASLDGIYDINRARAEVVSEKCGGIHVYDDFDKMLEEGKPDVVIVTTIDRFHHEYIIRSLEAGCDVISEKPMTIDAKKCAAIMEVEKKTGKKVTVTFNCRFMPYIARVKEIMKEGAVGEVLSVDFEWLLDTSHGADYFRRWHRKLENSGGLLVHKATHHFDIINWWIDEEPEDVFAFGTRRFYGPTRDEKGERCLSCQLKNKCEFYFDITQDELNKSLYYDTESADGYYRDRCVFAEEIDIYDTMSLNVRYSKGALLNYSLIAHSPYEGWRVAINGTKGRLEAEEFYSGQRAEEQLQHIRLYNRKSEVIQYDMKKNSNMHGGGDEHLRRALFAGDLEDELGQQAGTWEGAMSLMIGAAANISIKEGIPVKIKSLLTI